MVTFIRHIQSLNRVAIPMEILKELGIRRGDFVNIKLTENTIEIKKGYNDG